MGRSVLISVSGSLIGFAKWNLLSPGALCDRNVFEMGGSNSTKLLEK